MPFNNYRIEGKTAYLLLTDRHGNPKGEVLLDLADLLQLETENFIWRAFTAGRGDAKKVWYAQRNDRSGSVLLLHRHLMQPAAGEVVDHINRNSLDCRRHNMRVCTYAQNAQNLSSLSKGATGVRGVCFINRLHRPYIVSLRKRSAVAYRTSVSTLNIARITVSLARAHHWGVAAA